MEPLKVFDLRQGKVVEEKIYGGNLLRAAYSNFPLSFFIRQRWLQKSLSHVVGFYKKTGRSGRTIAKFVKDYEMSLDEYEVPDLGFASFNDFFIRKKKNVQFLTDPTLFPSPCDARLSATRIEDGVPKLKVKGLDIALPDLLGELKSKGPRRGWALTFRLCPIDYHRFHFVDSGVVERPVKMGTLLHSVNPFALEREPKIFEWNERQVTIQHGENYGELFYIEVGAMCVGSIHQTYRPELKAKRGEEKGYFDFGGSTVVLLVGETAGKGLNLNPVIEEKNAKGLEVLTRLGDTLGTWTGL